MNVWDNKFVRDQTTKYSNTHKFCANTSHDRFEKLMRKFISKGM